MAIPNINIDSSFYKLNITIVASILVFCLTTMATILKIFGRKTNPEELPGRSPHCKQQKESLQKIENKTKENEKLVEIKTNETIKKIESLQEITNEIGLAVAVLKNQCNNTEKDIDEIKQSNKEIANRLDDLLKQLLEWMN